MTYTIKEDEVCIKTRSTSASFAPATVKWTIENNNSNNEINIKINKRNFIYSRTPLFHSLNHNIFMSRRSIFLITDSLHNYDCGWSAVPKKDACALSF